MSKVKQRVFSGIQPSGAQVHIGNYLGAMKNFVTLAKEHETIVCLVDYHALTSVTEGKVLTDHTISLVASYLAVGLDPNTVTLFRQSDVPAVVELAWFLACHFPLGLLERAHAIKDAKAKGLNASAGLMFYPILMAADILLYKATLVPVGADQKQHLEMTREIVEKFNHNYGDVFPLPEPLISEATGIIPGLDGRKMSKSYDNYIGLFEAPKAVRKKVMRIVTDSKTVEDKKDPETCNIFSLYKLFALPGEIADLADKYRGGGFGYGHAKEALFEVIEREVAPLRESYENWMSRPDDMKDVLRSGAIKARAIADQTQAEVRKVVGVGPIL